MDVPDDSIILKQIGSKLKFHRLYKNLTQEELTEIAGFTRSYYTEIENGKRNPSILSLYKLSRALGVPLEKIVSDDKQNKGCDLN